jgi:aspartyl protease family protein
MRRTTLPSIALAFAFLASAGLPGWSVSTPAPAPLNLMALTELKAGQSGHVVVRAEINGKSTQVLVDTGASTVALSYEDAQNAGLRPNTLNFNIPVNTANGQTMAAEVTLRSVRIDSIRVDDVKGMVLPKGALKGTLLGMSFLGRLRSFKMENGYLVLRN